MGNWLCSKWHTKRRQPGSPPPLASSQGDSAAIKAAEREHPAHVAANGSAALVFMSGADAVLEAHICASIDHGLEDLTKGRRHEAKTIGKLVDAIDKRRAALPAGVAGDDAHAAAGKRHPHR